MKEIVINYFLDYEFVCIFYFCSMIFLLVSIFIKKQTIRIMLIMLFSIFFMLFVFEFILSFVMNKAIIQRFYDNSNLDLSVKNINIEHEMKLKNKKSGDVEIISVKKDTYIPDEYEKLYDAVYSYYDNGFRYTKCRNKLENEYVFLGCSFVYGDGLNDNETLPYYFSRLYNFNINVLNCGVRGKGTNTAINILNSNIFDNIKVKKVFYTFFYDHINRNFNMLADAPCDSYVYDNCEYYRIYEPYIGLQMFFLRSYIFRKIFLPIIKEKNISFYEESTLNMFVFMDKIVREKLNSSLTIIVWQTPEQKGDNNFLNKLRNLKLDFIFLPSKFSSLNNNEYKIDGEGHPSAKANREIAQILYNHINEEHNKSMS